MHKIAYLYDICKSRLLLIPTNLEGCPKCPDAIQAITSTLYLLIHAFSLFRRGIFCIYKFWTHIHKP